ncbi:purine-cytosine permease-like protein [Amycolatopsis echigonensis]|uniref:Purine-cytosine permease-like protein n=1 Tax=Amycolatopsis echigonensis TaxID=2576905 RepID=A0A2N3X1Y7_9PSEU|nr:cytosine permease [Amycolatopsis niigatensis]PKW00115.1 purine-cytosine permease-like protein [Amycolatopsis niigatensis]
MPGRMSTDEGVDTATHAIPDTARAGRFSLTMSWWGVCSALFYIFLGASLSVAYGSVNTIIAMVLSVITYGLINGVLSRYAIKTGLSVALISRVLFGKVGALVATAIFSLTAMYYAIFEGSVIATAANKVTGLSYFVAAVIVVVYSVPLVLGSVQNFLDKLNGVLLPFYLLGLGAAVTFTIVKYGWSGDWATFVPKGGAPSWGWLHAYVGYMGVWVLMMFTVDFARFGARKHAGYHRWFNFGMPFYLVTLLLSGLVGIFLINAGGVATVSETGVVDQLIVVLGGVPALLFIWVTQTRINSANYYLATVNMQAFFDRAARIKLAKGIWAVVVGTVVLIMMSLTDVFSYLLLALNYQGIFVTAWVAVAMVHILSGTYKRLVGDEVDHDRVPAVNPAGLGAWVVGAGLGLVMTLTGFGADWAPLATVVISAGLYAALLPRARSQWFTTSTLEPAVQPTVV